MKDRVRMATTCLQISAAVYAVFGLLCLAALATPSIRSEMGADLILAVFIISVVLIVVIEVVASGLHRRRFWAWVAALCLFAMYLPSLFLPLGALGLWGLLSPGSRVTFGIGG